MAKLKFKSNGKWESIAAFQGEPGKDGAIQYTAGKGITIENDTISAEVDKQYVDDAVSSGSSGGAIDTIVDVNAPLTSKDIYNQKGQMTIGNTDTDVEFIEQLRSAVQLIKDNILAGKTGSVILKLNFKPDTFISWTADYYERSLLFTLFDSGNGIINETANSNRIFFRNTQFVGDKKITRTMFFSTSWDEDNRVTISSNPQLQYSESIFVSKTYVDTAITSAITTALEADY